MRTTRSYKQRPSSPAIYYLIWIVYIFSVIIAINSTKSELCMCVYCIVNKLENTEFSGEILRDSIVISTMTRVSRRRLYRLSIGRISRGSYIPRRPLRDPRDRRRDRSRQTIKADLRALCVEGATGRCPRGYQIMHTAARCHLGRIYR